MPKKTSAKPKSAQARATTDLSDLFRCSFCAKSSAEVKRLVGGPGVFICDGCVGACVGIIDAHKSAKVADLVPPWESMSDDEMLAALPNIAAAAERVQEHIDQWVEELRARNVTWARIGDALGMTRQSAWERLKK